MAAEKFGGATGNNPGAITHDLALSLKELGIASVTIVDRANGTKTESSLQLISVTGRDRDKDQDMHMLWGEDRGEIKYVAVQAEKQFPQGS